MTKVSRTGTNSSRARFDRVEIRNEKDVLEWRIENFLIFERMNS